MTVETTEFKNHPAEYLGKIQSTGENITIVMEKKPVALLIPLTAPSNGTTLIDRLIDSPLHIKDFAPLSRAEIYDKK
ncbi:MAG: type II toxin-antitoxin system Phd/YefM family antitoxin [Limisphaerales bacterium]